MSRLDRLRWGTGVGAIVVVALGGAAACGESFENACQKTHTCAPPKDGGSGEGGSGSSTLPEVGGVSGDDGGAAPTEGGAASGAGAASSADGGEPPTVPMVGLGDECETNGALSCSGPAQKLTLLCKDGVWTESTICEADENCDQSTGVCTPILEECAEKAGGELYCGANDTVFSCGPDLVSSEEVEKCAGKCVPSAASAACAPETCGDGKEQAPEECDDGNEDDSDECTNACTKAKCGDGATWKDHEQCDDGNLKTDDACTDKCVPATCGDGFVWAGKETCDDKNKVDNDSCTNACQKPACGNGTVQAGEECDDKNVKSGDGCSKTCTVEPVEIVPVGEHMICARGSNGQIRCFAPGASDWAYTTVPLAAGEKATQIAGAFGSVDQLCALVGGNIRCWGNNSTGQLGLGDKIFRPYNKPSTNVDLGSGVAVKSLAVGARYACAVLSDGATKCWGTNSYNELGFVKDPANPFIGDASGEMGTALLPVYPDVARQAKSVSASLYQACQVRTDSTLYCWGVDAQAATTAGNDLNLGSVLTVLQVAVGDPHACAILTDKALKCWGRNDDGELGLDDTATRNTKATMGDALPPVSLGLGKSARYVAVNVGFTCAVLNDGSVKCWGLNSSGQLGSGSKESVGGSKGDMAALQAVNLGTGRKAKQLALTGRTNCALLEDGTVTCWGTVNTPTQDILGDEPNEMGDNLPVIVLKF